MTAIPPSLETIEDEEVVVLEEGFLPLNERIAKHTMEMRRIIQCMTEREARLVKAIERTERLQKSRFETRKMELMLEHEQNIEYLRKNHELKMKQIAERMSLELKYELAKYAAYVLMVRIERKEQEFTDLFKENGQFEELLYEAIERAGKDSKGRAV